MARRGAKKKAPSQCQHCKQRVIFVHMVHTGGIMPTDVRPMPLHKPTVARRNRAGKWIGYVVTTEHRLQVGFHMTTSHFATCRVLIQERSGNPKPSRPETLF